MISGWLVMFLMGLAVDNFPRKVLILSRITLMLHWKKKLIVNRLLRLSVIFNPWRLKISNTVLRWKLVLGWQRLHLL